MYEIQTSVDIKSKKLNIRNNGDFRVILDCFSALSDVELNKQERLFASLIIFYEDFDDIEDVADLTTEELELALSGMYKFFNCGQENGVGTQSNYKLIDWEQDEQLISSAINKVAGKEIRLEPYIHWWTFMGYYAAIGESPIASIITIREKIMQNKKLEKYEQEFRRSNPQYFVWNSKTVDAQEADELVREIWNKNG